MKKILSLVAAFCCLTFIAAAQTVSDDNVPAAVRDAFKSRFSIAEKTHWELDYDNFQAQFSVGKTEFAAWFDKEGTWVQTQTLLKPSELPKSVKDQLIREFGELSAYKVGDASKVETPKGVQYNIEVIKGEVTYEMVFSEKGEIISKEEKKEETKQG